jgi:hypothetical protein
MFGRIRRTPMHPTTRPVGSPLRASAQCGSPYSPSFCTYDRSTDTPIPAFPLDVPVSYVELIHSSERIDDHTPAQSRHTSSLLCASSNGRTSCSGGPWSLRSAGTQTPPPHSSNTWNWSQSRSLLIVSANPAERAAAVSTFCPAPLPSIHTPNPNLIPIPIPNPIQNWNSIHYWRCAAPIPIA